MTKDGVKSLTINHFDTMPALDGRTDGQTEIR